MAQEPNNRPSSNSEMPSTPGILSHAKSKLYKMGVDKIEGNKIPELLAGQVP